MFHLISKKHGTGYYDLIEEEVMGKTNRVKLKYLLCVFLVIAAISFTLGMKTERSYCLCNERHTFDSLTFNKFLWLPYNLDESAEYTEDNGITYYVRFPWEVSIAFIILTLLYWLAGSIIIIGIVYLTYELAIKRRRSSTNGIQT